METTWAGNLGGRQDENRGLKNVWGTQWGRLFAHLRVLSWGQQAQRALSRNKGTGWHHLLPLPPGITTELGERAQCQPWLLNLLTPCPTCALLVLSFPVTFPSVSGQWVSSPEDQQKPLPTPCLPTRVLQAFGSSGSSIRSH